MKYRRKLLSRQYKLRDSFYPGFICIATLFSIVVYSCTEVEPPVYDNPFDPEYQNFVYPDAKIMNNIRQDSVLNVSSLTFFWQAQNAKSTFSYFLKGYDETYSQWISSTQSVYGNLDEGTYTFMVLERYNPSMVQQSPDTLRFKIDAVKDCSLLLRRWAVKAGNGTTFTLNLEIENVANMGGMKAVINYSTTSCSLLSIEKVPDSVEGTDGLIMINSSPVEANNTGNIEISAVCLGGNTGFTGNGTVCQLRFYSNSDAKYFITFDAKKTELRDTYNNNIKINLARGSVVN